jgi:XTP/dITP diphosphohydrolase
MEQIMPKLLLGSTNKGKIKEFKALLENLKLELITPLDLDLKLEVPEVGRTYAENATIKARTFACETGYLTLADDSGLEVEMLDNAPGLFSARYDPKPGASDADRRKYLLKQLRKYPRPWKARFHCSVAVAEPGGIVHLTEGKCEGEIDVVERGNYGFGYDPIFFIPALGKTMAELTMDEKNQVSHRANAVRKAIPIILALIK